jgi:hypothetical protein
MAYFVCGLQFYVMQKLFFSDDFIQAQQQLARWASEDVVSVVVMESDSSALAPSPITITQNINPLINSSQMVQQQLQHQPQLPQQSQMVPLRNGLDAIVCRTDYYPSPPQSTTSGTESSGTSHMLTQRRGIDAGGEPLAENTGRYPEYKH